MTNYIPDSNPFCLAAPPQWWLRQLWEFDSSLVVVPSQQIFCYRLGQRRPIGGSEKITNSLLDTQTDTRLLAKHSLIPVTTIRANPHWDNPLMWKELAERAPWRMGGAAKAAALVEQNEQMVAHAKHVALQDNIIERAKDGWKSYQYRTGARTSFAIPAKTPTGQAGRKPVPAPRAEVKPHRIVLTDSR